MEDPAVARAVEAMRQTPRADYLPDALRASADRDTPLALGGGATCSQPSTVVAMLALLDAQPGDRVLDVGSGSGWTTAILARLVGPAGRVWGVELLADLVRDSALRLRRDALTWACVQHATIGTLGLPAQAPYHRILVSAAASRLPSALVAQLGEGGIIVLPVRDRLVRAERTGDSSRQHEAPGRYRFVPLL